MTTDLESSVLEKIAMGENLITSLQAFEKLDGIQKLHRKITQELKFLRKITKSNSIKKEHLQCSNLTHFSALIKTLSKLQKCVSVSKVFTLHDRKISIDIICDDGLTWVKVIARNAKSLSQISNGDSSYGVRSILDQAADYIECSKLNPCLFQIPSITFHFASGVGAALAAQIEALGIKVQGGRLHDDTSALLEPSTNLDNCDLTKGNNMSDCDLTRVNLDVSAMLAYVSSVTNGSAQKFEFSVQVLAQQAQWERERPQKSILDAFFQNKQLLCCQTARDSFGSIVETVGGPNEKIRAGEFLKRVTVLADDASVDDYKSNVQLAPDKILNVKGRIRERSLVIFTFGDRIGAVTVTANDAFVRSAKQQGINFVVFVHESRALTEQKEYSKAIGIM